MIAALRAIRISRSGLVLVASVSALASALVITTALGRTASQRAALAALAHRPQIVRIVSAQPAASTTAAVPSAPASDTGPAPASASPAPAAAPSTGTDSSAGSGSGSSSGPGSGSSAGSAGGSHAKTPRAHVKHVFVIMLSTPSFDAAFGRGSVARYLSRTLRRQGTLLGGYQSLGAGELPESLAGVSGQAPNADTRAQCSTYAEFPADVKPSAAGLITGPGCVYPNTIITIGDQVTAAGHVWKAFIEDMQPQTCVHPNSGAQDGVPLPGAGPQYATRHNPFVYFHSLLDLGGCSSDDVSLTRLPRALRSRSVTPTYSFIAPRACDDASATTCPDGRPAGLAGEDAFLRTWVPKIRRSAAYRHDGVLVIAFAPSAGSSASTAAGLQPTGALVLSRYARRDRTIATTYDAYSLLRACEDLLGYKRLAHAQHAKSFVAAALPLLAHG